MSNNQINEVHRVLPNQTLADFQPHAPLSMQETTTQPNSYSPSIYTPFANSFVGGVLQNPVDAQKQAEPEEPQEPAVMINLYIELKLQGTDNQKDVEKEFLKRLLAFSKSDKNMQISLVKQPRDYYEHEVIKIS